MLAQDYSRFAEIVAQCLEEHIRRVPTWMKLPAFYLLDAISKNVFEPYARHFASFVIPLFLETYGQVDEITRNKMEEMLLTWRTGSPAGKELFGVPPQIAIERGVWGDGGANYNSFSLSSRVTKAQVLSELEYTLGQKERALQVNPYDSASQNHVNVLHQLRRLVEAGVSQEELQQILGQLRALVRQAPSTSSTASWPPQLPYSTPASYPPASATSSTMRSYGAPYPNGRFPKSEGGNFSASASSSTSPSAVSSGEIANLLSTLLRAGVVSASPTPEGTVASSKDDEKGSENSSISMLDVERESSRNYRKFILGQKVQLASLDITRKRSNIAQFLYGQSTAQCKQCGIRFADNVAGKKKMEDHLDMHFRQNRKATQNLGRGHSRSWFISIEDWLHDLPRDTKGKGREDGPGSYNAKASVAEVAKRDAELRAQYVVVPPGDEAKPLSCPICKELLKSEFLEDDEDWVWKNAIKKEEKVYHATCYAEATAVKSSYAARLLLRSRSGTPETQSSLVTPPAESRVSRSKSPSISPVHESKLAGTKRKIQSSDSAFIGDSTPPLKKSALSS
ncbi:hypothetical protein APHAL10511_001934 [Amanita phalloides]|nr:hypothetical protein APHAL10511_001934 [Amanita phalloides]